MKIKNTLTPLLLLIATFGITYPSFAFQNEETAIFSMGCFWCAESDMEKIKGVISVTSGYTGGQLRAPDYQTVSAGNTGHIESIRVRFDPKIVSYQQLLNVFWPNVDPTDRQGQFCDKGYQYRAAIFYLNKKQQALALASKQALNKKFKHNYVLIKAASTFYPAEKYHQNYYKKNPIRYRFYRYRCGRDARLKQLWQ